MTRNATTLLRLQSWFSPAFPIGAFSYSHGLEAAVEEGLVADRETLVSWMHTLLRHGSGRLDGLLFAAAWRAVKAGDRLGFVEIAALAAAQRGTAELALENSAQGRAFLVTVQAAWPNDAVESLVGLLAEEEFGPALPVAAALACAQEDCELRDVLALYLQAFAANLVSAAVRLVPLGQTDGQKAVAALEDAVALATDHCLSASLEDLGAATPMLDWCSMKHETQHTRLFRS